MREAITMFQSMKRQATSSEKSPPYLFDYYNIEALYPPRHSDVKSFLARVLNAFIDTLNEEHNMVLPRYLIIMLDKDLIVEMKLFDYGVTRTLEDLLKWLLINVNNSIEVR